MRAGEAGCPRVSVYGKNFRQILFENPNQMYDVFYVPKPVVSGRPVPEHRDMHRAQNGELGNEGLKKGPQGRGKLI